MNNRILLAAVLFLSGAAGASPAHAGTMASLWDWCFNINGESSDVCNGGANPSLSGTYNGVTVSGNMDFTIATDGLNSLGSASFTAGPGSSFVDAYMDYDLNLDNSGSFNDSASVHGTLPAGYSFELDDPNTSNILCGISCLGDLGANALTDQNNVGNPSGLPNPCCDVAWALGVAVSVPDGYEDTITFTVSTAAPASGFYLQQQNSTDPSQNIYLSANVVETQTSTPEPGTIFLFAAGLAGIAAFSRRGLFVMRQAPARAPLGGR